MYTINDIPTHRIHDGERVELTDQERQDLLKDWLEDYARIEAEKQFEYKRLRLTSYPTISDQLDMLYHDIKNGNLSDGNWIAAVEAIKNKYPKG